MHDAARSLVALAAPVAGAAAFAAGPSTAVDVDPQVFAAAPVPEPANVALTPAGLAGPGALARVTRRAR